MTPWTLSCRAPLSIGFSRQEYWSGLPFPSPGHLPDPGNKPRSSALQTFSLPSEPPGKPELFKVSNNSFISVSLVSGMKAGRVVAQQVLLYERMNESP